MRGTVVCATIGLTLASGTRSVCAVAAAVAIAAIALFVRVRFGAIAMSSRADGKGAARQVANADRAGEEPGASGKRLAVRVEEAARMLSIGRSKAYDLIRQGELPAMKIGTTLRVSITALEKFIEEQETRGETASPKGGNAHGATHVR